MGGLNAEAGGLNATVGGLNAYEVTILLLAIFVLRRRTNYASDPERRGVSPIISAAGFGPDPGGHPSLTITTPTPRLYAATGAATSALASSTHVFLAATSSPKRDRPAPTPLPPMVPGVSGLPSTGYLQ